LSYQSFSFFHRDAWFGNQGTYRANSNAGEAGIASGLSQRDTLYGTNPGLDALEGKIKDASALLVTHPDTLATQNALVRVIGK
jgi:hypothetical protein